MERDDEAADDRRAEIPDVGEPDPPQVLLEGPQVVAIVPDGRFPQSSLLAQVLEEPRDLLVEWIPDSGAPAPSPILGQYQPQHLLDRVSGVILGQSAPLGRGVNVAMRSQPKRSEGGYVVRELGPARSAAAPSKLPETHDDRHTPKDGARRVSLLGEPHDVSLERLGEPECSQAVQGVGLDEVVFQHGNLHSERGRMEVSMDRSGKLCDQGLATNAPRTPIPQVKDT
jgi:hypothetical protein